MRCALPYAVAWCKKRNETKWSGNKRNETKRTTCQLVLLQAECEWRESVFHLDARNSQRVPHLVHKRLDGHAHLPVARGVVRGGRLGLRGVVLRLHLSR